MNAEEQGQPNKRRKLTPYTPMPHRFLEFLLALQPPLSGCEWAILMALARRTLGYHRRDVELPTSELAAAIHRSRNRTKSALRRLEERRLIFRERLKEDGTEAVGKPHTLRLNKAIWRTGTDQTEMEL